MHYDIVCHSSSNARLSSKKIFFKLQKNPCIFVRLCYSLSMTEKEKEIAKLTAQLEQIAEDLLDPMLDDQTTVLINAMGKVREKIKRLEK
jgi:hypothetical protein